jgi:hypothetical protein
MGAGISGGSTGAWQTVASSLLTGAAASVSFSSITPGYKIFKLYAWIKCVGAASLAVTLNSDGGASYDTQYVRGVAAAASAAAAFGGTSVGLNSGGAKATLYEFTIHNTALTETKDGVITYGWSDEVSVAEARFNYLHWKNTANEIATITLTPTANFSADTEIILTGLRA